MSEGLKPCPFCGSKAQVQSHCGCYYVKCNDCNASGGVVQEQVYSGSYDDILANEAIDKWNRRVQ